VTARTAHSAKAKGRRFQQEIRDVLITELGIDPLDIKSTAMGQSGCDLYLSKSAREKFPFGVECKNKERLNIWKDLKQARTNAEAEGLKPLLAFRRNHTPVHVVLELTDFLDLVKKREE